MKNASKKRSPLPKQDTNENHDLPVNYSMKVISSLHWRVKKKRIGRFGNCVFESFYIISLWKKRKSLPYLDQHESGKILSGTESERIVKISSKKVLAQPHGHRGLEKWMGENITSSQRWNLRNKFMNTHFSNTLSYIRIIMAHRSQNLRELQKKERRQFISSNLNEWPI